MSRAANPRKGASVQSRGRVRNSSRIVLYSGTSRTQAIEALKRAVAMGNYVGLKMRGKGGGWSVTATGAVKGTGRGNPAATASAGYEEFHGHPSSEVVTVTKQVHFHEHLSGAGQLRKLIVKGIDGKTHSITGFKGAVLAFNEKKSQLFIEGGDQTLSVQEFGIRKPHELETLGQVKAIEYQTDKSHLGDEGGHAVYAHRFRTTNQNGEHVTVKIARYPDLIYRVLDQQLEFSGGSYEIRAEGIDK